MKNPYALSISVISAIISWFAFKSNQKSNDDKASFEEAKEGFNDAYTSISDLDNPSRQNWLGAARTLKETLDIEKEIKSAEYKNKYRRLKNRYRGRFYQLLNPNGVPLPPQFFYGVKNWPERQDMELDDAALEVSGDSCSQNLTIDKNPPPLGEGGISPASVVTIYDFLDYPKDYVDPLREVKLWEGEYLDCVKSSHQGAMRYIQHQRESHVIAGKLVKVKSNVDSEEEIF